MHFIFVTRALDPKTASTHFRNKPGVAESSATRLNIAEEFRGTAGEIDK